MLKRITFSFLMILIGLFSTTAWSETVALANGDWKPYLGKDLPGGGPVARLVKAAFENQGWDVKYEYYPWKRGFQMAKNADLDGSIVWSYNDERAQDFLYSDPVIDLKTVVFYNKDKPVEWPNKEDLKGLKLGGVVGYDYAFVTEDNGYTIERVGSPENNYKKLAAGRLDGVMEELLVGQQLASEVGVADQVDYNPKPIKSNPYHLIVGKANPRAQKVIDTFNKGIAALKASGEYNKILDIKE
ncbi:transporter substrate-binding domain-containing protein [Marinobacteraceae bacterium S3BR75-40.1]